jgi:hypothetical protein
MPCRTNIAWWVGRNPERERETRLVHRPGFVGDLLNCQGLAYMRPQNTCITSPTNLRITTMNDTDHY